MTSGTSSTTRVRIESGRQMFLAGFRQVHRGSEAVREIPRQWRRLWPYFDSLPNRVGEIAYGLRFTRAEVRSTDYMCAIEIEDFDDLPPELDTIRIPRRSYVVLRHNGGMSELLSAWRLVWLDWYAESGLQFLSPPDIERYDDSFDPASGEGTIELWIPVPGPGPR